MGHQSYVLLCTETTLSNPPVVQPKTSCAVHLLRSPWSNLGTIANTFCTYYRAIVPAYLYAIVLSFMLLDGTKKLMKNVKAEPYMVSTALYKRTPWKDNLPTFTCVITDSRVAFACRNSLISLNFTTFIYVNTEF